MPQPLDIRVLVLERGWQALQHSQYPGRTGQCQLLLQVLQLLQQLLVRHAFPRCACSTLASLPQRRCHDPYAIQHFSSSPLTTSPPVISVLLHCPPDSQGLAGTLASLLQAGAELPWQLVAVSDQSEPLLEAFADQRPAGQVQMIPSAASSAEVSEVITAAAARNRGLAHCRAPLVACLNPGQRCHPQRFHLPLQLLNDHSALQLVWGGWQVGGVQHQPWLRPLGFSAAERLGDPCLPAAALTVRRAVLEELGGFHEGLQAWSGVELALRLAAAGGRMAWLAEPLLRWRFAPLTSPWPVQQLQQGLAQLIQLHSEGLRPELVVELRFAALAWCAGLAWQQQQPDLSQTLLLQAALSAPLSPPRALVQLLEQFCRAERWCGGNGDPSALQRSALWSQVRTLWGEVLTA